MKGLVDLFKKRKNTPKNDYQQQRYPIDENERGRGRVRERIKEAEREEIMAPASSQHENTRHRRQNHNMTANNESYNYYKTSEDDQDTYDNQWYSSSSSYMSSSSYSTSNPSSSSSLSRQEHKKQYKKDMNRRKRNGKKRSKFSREKKKYSQKLSSSFEQQRKETFIDNEHHNELLTREELFELPARELRNKCRVLGLDASRVVEKEGLVLLIHNFYRRQSNERKVNSSPLKYTLHNSTNFVSSTNTPKKVQIPVSTNPIMSNFPLLNDENEQMVEILFEIIPYYGQGDPSIDSIVMDTIQRLPFYCLESREPLAGNTLMMLSCQAGAKELVSMLLSKGSDFNAQNRNGETCLHFVCYNDSYSPEIAQMLVNKGAQAEVPEKRFGCTPLHWAASAGDIDLCRILCSAGARANTIDKSGFDPIAYSMQSHKTDCVNFLKATSLGIKDQKETEGKSLDITNKDELGWEKLLDESTGYIYFHNWKTGQSMWEDDYIIYKRTINNGGLRPIASSFSNRPPPPSPGFKSFSLSNKSLGIEHEEPELDNRAQGKESTVIKHFEYTDEKEQKEEDVKAQETKASSIGNIDSTDLKNILSDSDLSSSPNSSMIEYEELGSEQIVNKKTNNTSNDIQTQEKCLPTSKMVTQGSFNLGLTNLQSRMEERLSQQLKEVEEKINIKKISDEVREESVDVKTLISELSSKVIQLQAEVGAKELEITSLKRQAVKVETERKSLKQSTDLRDTFVGDNDVRDSMWVNICDVNKVTTEVSNKEQQLLAQKEEIIDLKSAMKAKVREIEILSDNQARGKEQVLQIEELLKQEKEAKNEVIVLLQQTQRGIKVDAEVSKSFEEEKRRGEEELLRVKDQLKSMKESMANEAALNIVQFEEVQRELLSEKSKVESLKEDIRKQQEAVGEKEKIVLHKHLVEIEDIRASMQANFDKKIRSIENKLDEEKTARTQNELERDEAIKAYENASKKIKETELQAERMSTMIEEAKAMVGANEKLHRSLHLEIDKRKALHNHLEDLRGKIRVYVRIRPLSSSEIAKHCKEALIKEDKRTCVMHRSDNNRGGSVKSWEFDTIFQGSSTKGNSQEDVFKDTRRLVTSTIDGFNVCIFAYGQTGSGKTYTIWGNGGGISSDESSSLNTDLGLAPRVACELFRLVEERKTSFVVEVQMNMFELYNDNVRDLMASSQKNKDNNGTLRIKLAEHSKSGLVEVSGAVTESVENASQLLDLFRRGSEFRTTASTKMNADSSRSHLITSITVSLKNKRTDHVTNGKMTLVDLAGSERVGKSGATGNQLKEAQSINKSLSALGDVINALTSGSKHIPYRNHPLTMLMSDSMGGNAKTLMFVCCSPADYNSAETSNALDFAKRCKDVTNNVTGSSGGELGQVKALKAQLSRLKREKGDNMTRKMGVAKRPGRR